MAQGSGVAVIASLVQSTNPWWTATSANVPLKGLHIESDSIPIGSPELIPDNSLGSPWEKGNDLGNTVVDGDIVFKARYDSLNTLFGLCMGAAAAPASLGQGAYRHLLTLTPDLAGKFATYCVYDGVAVRENTSMKVTGFSMTGTGGQALDLTFQTMSDDRIVNSSVNTSLAAVTFLPADPRIIFDDVKIRINQQGAGALTDADSFYASDFNVTLARPHEAPFVTNRRSTRSEPIANGKPTVRISLTEAAYVDTSRIQALRARTAYKMDFEALGALAIGASTTYYYRLYLALPAVFFSATAYPIPGPTRIIPDLQMVGEQAATAPAGIGTTLPLRMELDNASSTVAIT